MRIQSLAGAWEFRQAATQEWSPATVPGGVHTDLLALDRIPDPFVGDNEKHVQWVAETDWEYRYQFTVNSEVFNQPQIWLVCDGLDTLAEICLNGLKLGHSTNMFRQFRWDVKPLLQSGQNELYVKFDSPVGFISEKQAIRQMPGVSHAIPGGPYIRKAPCHFGWDWGPKLPPIGIWKDIRLEGGEKARIEDVHLTQMHNEGQVTISAKVTVERWETTPCSVEMHIKSPDGELFETELIIPSESEILLQIVIPNPQLWWPNGHGKHPLYQVSIVLHSNGQSLDQRDFQLGLRTIELRQEADEWGRSFTFIVNGLPIFVKGSNWIPADSFPTRITDDYLEMLIKAAADTHQNMLRVWGGGFYEEERFYDLCDRYGVLVWQDFIFSCSVYPLNQPEFLENIRIEIIENIRRLRHRASLALWCGNNEMEWGWVDWGWKGSELEDMKAAYDQFFHHTLPTWCASEDPDHAYWPSSPSSDTPFEDPNGQQQGDAHYWDVWHGRKPFTAYRDQFPRFMSEFGFQALPPLSTIRTYADEADWNMTSYIMEQHQKNDSGNQLMVAQMLDTFRLPERFDSLVYLSLVLQAEGIRYGVEHWRRHPKRVSGILYWQLNDCWPVASWSSLDYFGRWKALHYAAKRFYAPLLLSIEDKQSVQDVYITNDMSKTWEGTLLWSLETLAGKVLKSNKEPVHAKPYDVTPVCQLDFSSQINDDNRRDLVFVAELMQNEQIQTRQTSYFVPTKHLNLVEPGISTKLSTDQDQVLIEIKSLSLARLLECSLEGIDVVFSDNYFDLPAGRPVVISIPLPAGWTLSQVQKALSIRSVYNSYAHGAAN
ncbi:MAG: glycoside hydrolase family 2 protein [Anaerolineaceae bacterium]|nr:glycoside hydrolase family 2 protein [Anaerolineaceae bacterium]